MIAGLPLLFLLLGSFSLFLDPVIGQLATVNPYPDAVYNTDPFNLTAEDTAAYTEPKDVTTPNSAPSTAGTFGNILAPNITGLKGVHPHGDRLKRTLCYCGDTKLGTKNSGSSYYHVEYYNAELDHSYSLNWTCIHRTDKNACKDKPKVGDKHCRFGDDGHEFCFEQQAKVVWDSHYWLGGEKRNIPFDKKSMFVATAKDVVMKVCRKMCDDFVGPAADRNDHFFNGIAYYKNSMDEYNVLDDICLHSNLGDGRCRE